MKTLYHLSTDGRLCNVLAELLYDVVADVRLQQGLADVPHSIRDIGLGNASPAGQRPENRIKFLG